MAARRDTPGARALNGGAPAARYGLAWCRHQSGAHAEAAAGLRELLRADPPEELRLAALELGVWAEEAAGDADAAAAAWRALAAAGREDGPLFEAAQVAARGLLAAGRPDDAQALYLELLQRVRDREVALGALVERTWIALDQGRRDEAESQVRAALELSADSGQVAEAAFFVGEAHYDAGEDARAAALYRVASSARESTVADKALYKEGFARLRAADPAGAAECFAGLVEEHGASELWGEGLFLLGESLFRLGRFAEAVAPLERLRSEAPRHAVMPKALFRLGLSLGQVQRWKDAEAALSELARSAPDFEQLAEAELWRGRALANLGNRRAAR